MQIRLVEPGEQGERRGIAGGFGRSRANPIPKGDQSVPGAHLLPEGEDRHSGAEIAGADGCFERKGALIGAKRLFQPSEPFQRKADSQMGGRRAWLDLLKGIEIAEPHLEAASGAVQLAKVLVDRRSVPRLELNGALIGSRGL